MTASQLVPVVPGTIGNVQCLTVDGRTLHSVLGVRRVFAAWIQGRIEKYGFVQGQDFEVFSNSGKNSEGGRPSQEYTCTLDMGKELCMVENNEKGRIARRYFIECERRLLSAEPVENPDKLPSLSPSHRSELKGIVDAKLSTYPASVQGKARPEIWTRFNRHFRIAEYSQLPTERMAEARDYPFRLYREGDESLCLKRLLAKPVKAPIIKIGAEDATNILRPFLMVTFLLSVKPLSAPHAGAWIETLFCRFSVPGMGRLGIVVRALYKSVCVSERANYTVLFGDKLQRNCHRTCMLFNSNSVRQRVDFL